MAEVRLTPSSLPALTPTAPARTSDAVRAAQRAFFNAALSASQSTAPARPAAGASATATPTPHANPLRVDPSVAPNKGMRPGSLLDIRV